MELMSILLLCAFLGSLPPALGLTYNIENKLVNTEKRLNNSIRIEKSKQKRGHQILNVKGPRTVTELQAVFRDDNCKHCLNCMERAVEAQEARAYNWSNSFSDDMYYDMKENFHDNHNIRKRYTQFTDLSNNTHNNTDVQLINNLPTNVTVTEYTKEDGKIYALKVIEINNKRSEQNDAKSTCRVYSVKKTLPCESEASNLILAKRKVNKKGRKSKERTTSTEKASPIKPVFKKREVHVERSYVSESFMPSIEEFY